MLGSLRGLVKRVNAGYTEQMVGLSGIHISVCEDPGCCPVCKGPWRVQKTTTHHGRTIAHGQFEVRETVHVCAARCRRETGVLVTRRSSALAEQLMPARAVGYDVMVFVGLRRFVDHLQREEIRSVLAREQGITISAGQISMLARLFLDYLEQLHNERSGRLRAALQDDGGWPLHLDATGEDGRGMLFVAMAGWRKWILGAWKLTTERGDLILPCLHQVLEQFGPPCAIMRDLGSGVCGAVDALLAQRELDIPVLACHLHVVKAIGNDLLGPNHRQMRDLFQQLKVRPQLRTLARELGRKLGEDVAQAREDVSQWQQQARPINRLPWGRAGIATVRALTQWILDYPADSAGLDFPYDRPQLDFYDRSMSASRAIAGYLREPRNDTTVVSYLKKLKAILNPVTCQLPFPQLTQQLRVRAGLFDELRSTLRLVSKPTAAAYASRPSSSLSADNAAARLRDIREQLDNFIQDLSKRRFDPSRSRDTRKAIVRILSHLEDYGPYLWGHAIPCPEKTHGSFRLVDRTNNVLEGFFKTFKHDERRRSGRRHLAQDLEKLPAQAALAYNLTCPDYVEILCGKIECLPKAFAGLDARVRERKLAGNRSTSPSTTPLFPQMVTASLPAQDKRLIRSELMNQKVFAAAKRRTPHAQIKQFRHLATAK